MLTPLALLFFQRQCHFLFCLQGRKPLDSLIIDLDVEYTAKYGDVLPESGKSNQELLF